MTDTNYTPDEIRLLDEFVMAIVSTFREEVGQGRQWNPSWVYNDAADLVAERRKRVARIDPMDELQAEMKELEPQPEQPADEGKLTEGAIGKWLIGARSEPRGAGYLLTWTEIDVGADIMREGLAAKQHHQNALAMLAHNIERNRKLDEENRTLHGERTNARVAQSLAEKERDEARARVVELESERSGLDCRFAGGRMAELSGSHCPIDRACARCQLDALLDHVEGERDEARAELGETKQAHSVVWAENIALGNQLAAAKPVLDAVVVMCTPGQFAADDLAAHKTVMDYADRRRNEERAKQQGGAS